MAGSRGAKQRAARERVAAYYESSLAALLEQLAGALDAYRGGAVDVHEADRVIHQYHRAAGELWKFCWSAGGHVEIVAQTIAQSTHAIDWWQRGIPRTRR